MRPLPLALVALLLGNQSPAGCDDSFIEADGSTTIAVAEPLEMDLTPERQGLVVRLSEDEPPRPEVEANPSGPAQPLTDARTAALLARLPDLPEEDLGKDFALRPASLPPPRTGADVRMLTPPEPPAAPEVEQGPLKVLRWAPEGAVPLAPHVSVTFSQPMVAVTSQEQAAETVPARLSPQPEGAWRWLGTKTLLFDPDPRLPMATEYTVEIPAGTRSATGNALSEALTWTFETPPVQVRTRSPVDGPHALDPVIFLAFDQRVDPAAITPFVHLRGGAHPVTLRPATPEEIAADEGISYLVEHAVEGRWLALMPAEPLTPGTSYTVTLAKGAPSAEGPITTCNDWSGGFYTYHPLAISSQDCSWGLDGCNPQGSFWLYLNNPLDEATLADVPIQVSPEVEGLRVEGQGAYLTLTAQWKSKTRYTVTLPPELRDTFGQTLGQPEQRTFAVGRAERSLQGPGRDFVVLDPAAPPAFPVWSVNHRSLKLRVWKQDVQDYPRVSKWMREAQYDDFFGRVPGRLVATLTVKVENYVDDELIETDLDLSPYLKDGKGQLLVWVEPTVQPKERWARVNLVAWVQATDLGLVASVDQDEVRGWATSLSDGHPLEGVELSLLGEEGAVTSDAQGLATLPAYTTSEGPHALIARLGKDEALLPDQQSWWNESGTWYAHPTPQSVAWYVFDDRKMYRPGEEVRVKGWLRRLDTAPGGDLHAFAGAGRSLHWRLTDVYGNEMSQGDGEVSESGGFDLALQLPDTPNLGDATLQLNVGAGGLTNTTYYHNFQIQEFRRPEFEVVTSLDERPYVLGEHARPGVSAAYYAGGALPNADADWLVSWQPGSYAPPGLSDWQFGTWSPWWWVRDDDSALSGQATLSGTTDASGEHHVRIDFLSLDPPRPVAVHVEAGVMDENRQRWASGQDLVLHPAALYVGLKTDRPFYEQGQPIDVGALAVDIDGHQIADAPVHLAFRRLDWRYAHGQWREVRTELQATDLTSAEEALAWQVAAPEGGQYELLARVTDAEGRPNETAVRLWIAGGLSLTPDRGVSMEQVQIVPNADDWQPGETAELLLVAPFYPAEALWTLSRDGVMETGRLTLEEASAVLRLPVTEAWVPGVTLEVDVVGSKARTNDRGEPLPEKARRVAEAHGSLTLKVPPRTRTLAVTVTPREATLEPGGDTTLDLTVLDASGGPVRAEVAVVAVDESVLALTGYRLPDPLEVFYALRGSGLQQAWLRDAVVLGKPEAAASNAVGQSMPSGSAYGAGGAAGYAEDEAMVMDMVMQKDSGGERKRALSKSAPESSAAPRPPPAPCEVAGDKPAIAEPAGPAIEVRADFSALALFAPHVLTDEAGHAVVPLELPDSLTRYRIMAVAVDSEHSFGSTDTSVTARKPLMLRPSPPRFLNFGDRAELPFLVQNQTDRPLTVDLALRVANARVIGAVEKEEDGARTGGLQLVVPPNDRREVRIPVAARLAGTARFQAVAVSGDLTDAATFELPVWTPATTEAFATYGTIDEGAAAIPVEAPRDAWPQFGGLEVTTSSTALSALTDAVLYLASYPFDCTEQIASKILAVAALKDVLDAFDAEGLPPADELRAAVQAEIKRIDRRQHWNGGFSFWPGMPDHPYVTVYTAHALVLAEQKGFDVPNHVLNRAMSYLGDIESHIPYWWSREARWALIAYSVHVRHLHGDDESARARRLLAEGGIEGLPMEALGWILPTLAAKGDEQVEPILRHLDNRATETAATAQWDVSYTDENDYVLLHSSRRTDAVLLDALMQVRPEHDLVVKVVQGLLDHRVAGRWSSTQENSFVLLAMDRYFRTYEGATPDFLARAWFGQGYAGEHAFRGRTTERATTELPMAWLAEQRGAQDLILAKEGPGRMYYRVGMRYAPHDLVQQAADYGFAVERRYEPVDEAADVVRQPDGSWAIRAGARVRVRLTMVAPARRTHVALVDPLPAGLEPMNPELAVTGTIPEDPSAQTEPYWWWRRAWYEHQNLRDERVEAFTTLLWEGVHTYTYVATATTPGRFVVPPTKAEEMYHPETFGRGASDVVWVR
ncbi:MAG: Ig-like domain-containing protein [Pseudomonadota bacterium]